MHIEWSSFEFICSYRDHVLKLLGCSHMILGCTSPGVANNRIFFKFYNTINKVITMFLMNNSIFLLSLIQLFINYS